MGLVMGSTADHSDWLKANRHDMAFGSRGVIADVKKGGLRRDLSLAFEMDGDKEIVRRNPVLTTGIRLYSTSRSANSSVVVMEMILVCLTMTC